MVGMEDDGVSGTMGVSMSDRSPLSSAVRFASARGSVGGGTCSKSHVEEADDAEKSVRRRRWLSGRALGGWIWTEGTEGLPELVGAGAGAANTMGRRVLGRRSETWCEGHIHWMMG